MLIRILVLVCTVLLAAPVYAGGKIDLVQSDGSITPLGGVGDSSNVYIQSVPPGGDTINGVQVIEQRSSYRNITTATNTEVQNQSGHLYKIMVNAAVANGVIAIYDGLNSTTCSGGGGSLIGTVTMPAVLLQNHFALSYDTDFGTGLCITTTGTPNITVLYR